MLGGKREKSEKNKTDENDVDQGQYYYNTIEGYKIVLDNKNQEINQMTATMERMQREIEFLKAENEANRQTALAALEHVKWLERLVDRSQ